MTWYSTCIRSVCLIEDEGATRYEDSVFVLKAADWDVARRKAMAIGEAREEIYTNSDGIRVRWAFESIVSLDQLDIIKDGTEIYSMPIGYDGPPVTFGHEFTPGGSEPTHSI